MFCPEPSLSSSYYRSVHVKDRHRILKLGLEGFRVGLVVKMSTISEFVPSSETISQTAQEGLGIGAQEIAKLEMPESGHSGETSQPGQEGLRVRKVVRMPTMAEDGESDGETSEPVVSGSTSEMSLGAAFECDLKSEQMGRVHSKGESNGAATQNPNGLDEIRTAGAKLQSDSIKKMEVEQFEASKDSERSDAKEKKGKKIVEFELVEPSKDSERFDAKEKKGNTSVEVELVEKDFEGFDAVEVSENKKKRVEVELVEASKGSEWFRAIEKKDCKLLLQLLRSDRSLWVQTGLKGRSVLHVALMQGCSELVHKLHSYQGHWVCCGKNWETPLECLWQCAKDGRLKDASARDIWLVMEGPSDDEYERELLVDRSWYHYLQSHVVSSMSVDREMLSLREAISHIARDMGFGVDEDDVDFNFEDFERKELYVHMACSRLQNVDDDNAWRKFRCVDIVDFVIAVLSDLSKKDLLKILFDQKDAQGRTILQILATCSPREDIVSTALSTAFGRMLAILPVDCVNTRDKAGRTVLHWAVAHNTSWAVKQLLLSEKATPELSFQTAYILNITAFHLSLLYENELWKNLFHNSLKAELQRGFCIFRRIICPGMEEQSELERIGTKTSLLWAILMNWNEFVKYVMEKKLDQDIDPLKKNELLAMAALSGNAEILQLYLQKQDVDKLNVVCDLFGVPPLHLAVNMSMIRRIEPDARAFNDWLHCNDFISIKLLEKKLQEQNHKEDIASANINTNQYSGKRACASLLLQAGADILATVEPGRRMADPGVSAPIDEKQWWYGVVAEETFNIKTDLNAAGTATAVVATIVATASFVGPLTPPLNYVTTDTGLATTIDVGVQITEFLIIVFLLSNGLSFYLAITSIMLSIIPSVPTPKEGLVFGRCYDLKGSQKILSIAILYLLASIISVLIAFSASSLVVIPSQQRGVIAYTMAIAGLMFCSVGIFFFSFRCLRLIFPRNTFIKTMYEKTYKL